jgi:hypothetical protein
MNIEQNARSRYIVAFAVLAAVAIGILGANPYLPGGGDNAGYIAEAESLLSSGQRRQLFTPDSPAETSKPPLFPAMLALLESLAGRSVVAMKFMLVLFAAAAVLAAAYAIKTGLEENPSPSEGATFSAACIALWFALTPSLTYYSHDILSDVPYTFFALSAIGLAGQAGRRDSISWHFPALIGVLVAANLLRSVGMLCCAACAGYFCIEAILRRRDAGFRRLAIYAAILAALTVAAYVFVKLSEHGYFRRGEFTRSVTPSAGGTDESLIQCIQRVASMYALFIPAEIAGYEGFGPALATPLLILLGVGAAFAGTVTMWRRGQRLIPIGFVLQQGPLLVYPFVEPRYYLPSLALFLCLFWTGCKVVQEWARTKGVPVSIAVAFLIGIAPCVSIIGTWRFFGADAAATAGLIEWVVGAALLGMFLALTFAKWRMTGLATCMAAVFLLCAASRTISENIVREQHRGAAPIGAGWPEFYEAVQSIKPRASDSDVVISAKPSLVWFWTGLRGCMISSHSNSEENEKQVAGAKWVIVDELPEDRAIDRIVPLLKSKQDDWKVVFRKNQTAVLRRVK